MKFINYFDFQKEGKKSPSADYNINLSFQFVTKIFKKLENVECDILNNEFQNKSNCRRITSNQKELQVYEQIKYDLQTKTDKINQIEHYFNIVDRQLQFTIKKKMFEHNYQNYF